MSVKNVDNQIDHVIDRQIDSPEQVFTEITRKSRVFSIPYTGPVYEPLPINGLPNIEVATTEIIQVSNYALLNGIYTKGFDVIIGIYFIRDDGQYYIWDNAIGGSGWEFQSLTTYDVISQADYINGGYSLLPSEGWRSTMTTQPIPLEITFLG